MPAMAVQRYGGAYGEVQEKEMRYLVVGRDTSSPNESCVHRCMLVLCELLCLDICMFCKGSSR